MSSKGSFIFFASSRASSSVAQPRKSAFAYFFTASFMLSRANGGVRSISYSPYFILVVPFTSMQQRENRSSRSSIIPW